MMPRTTYIIIVVILIMGHIPVAMALPSHQEEPCVGEMGCYEMTPPPLETGNANVPWQGYSDGRLNADMAEYYSVWCRDGSIEVWRGVPASASLNLISIGDAFALSVGETWYLDNGMSLMRNDELTFTVYGSNGNLAPQHGSKSFNLSGCSLPNTPTPTPTATPFSGGITSNVVSDPLPGGFIPTCADEAYFLENWEDCLGGETSLEILFDWALRCLGPLFFPTVVVSFAAFRPRKNRK